MTNRASTSNPSFIVDVGEAFPYRSHAIGPSIVTVKLSGKNKFNLWRLQMRCLLKSQHMDRFIEGAGKGKEKEEDMEAWTAGDSLVKGWILGSISEEAARKAINNIIRTQMKTVVTVVPWDFTAKDLWEELQRSYGPPVRKQVAGTKSTTRQAESDHGFANLNDAVFFRYFAKRSLYMSVLEGNTDIVIKELQYNHITPTTRLTDSGNTVLHVAVGSSSKNPELLKELLDLIPTDQNTLLNLKNSQGSTVLHVAAKGGNIEAVNILVERNPELLSVEDSNGRTPLALSISNMHLKASECLFEYMEEKGYSALFEGKTGEELVVLAISGQDFRLATTIISKHYAIQLNSDAVLTALAENFPRELKFWERRTGFGEIKMRLDPYLRKLKRFSYSTCWQWPLWTFCLLFTGLCVLPAVFQEFLKVLVRLFFKDAYISLSRANLLIEAVSMKLLSKDSTYPFYYRNSIFEATRRNSSTYIRTLMKWFPDAIWIPNEDGHNFIQYSVINRSEKIYNLLYEMSEHKNIYKTMRDYYGNNLLHLAARLAPTNKLDLISGAALQIQRELQWFNEVERFTCPLNKTQKNSDDETPGVVFTREHKDLVIEGEKWIKKTAHSYTITATLIITIVFAAAITVPGGNNQESGIPIFTNNTAFTVFAISDAISLFTAVTSLLMFLSILTARFTEQDFLYKLPTKMIIGLTMLFISTTTMIIAFGATLFLVFGQANLLMLIPIGALTCLPITSFVTLQCPLIIELISATYGGGIFVREENDYFY